MRSPPASPTKVWGSIEERGGEVQREEWRRGAEGWNESLHLPTGSLPWLNPLDLSDFHVWSHKFNL